MRKLTIITLAFLLSCVLAKAQDQKNKFNPVQTAIV